MKSVPPYQVAWAFLAAVAVVAIDGVIVGGPEGFVIYGAFGFVFAGLVGMPLYVLLRYLQRESLISLLIVGDSVTVARQLPAHGGTGSLQSQCNCVWTATILQHHLNQGSLPHAQMFVDLSHATTPLVKVLHLEFEREVYKDLVPRLPAEGKAKLKEAQLAWIDERNSSCSRRIDSGFYVNLSCATRVTRNCLQVLQERVRECKSSGCLPSKL